MVFLFFKRKKKKKKKKQKNKVEEDGEVVEEKEVGKDGEVEGKKGRAHLWNMRDPEARQVERVDLVLVRQRVKHARVHGRAAVPEKDNVQ